mmetsp:Transcript_12522/g.29041  ORF Transcript_12522/g.29041 Transcript_12522/m.29041 type:complete len:208 (-) Transcript_12522:677-1300(-)
MQDFSTFFVYFSVKGAHHSKKNDSQSQNHQLPATPKKGCKQGQQGGCSKDIAMYLFPTTVFRTQWLLFFIIVSFFRASLLFQIVHQSIPGIVLLEGAQKNQCYQSHQKENHHERIEDGEPVNGVLEEIVIQIPIKPRMKFFLGLFPFDQKSKRKLGTFFDDFKRLGIGCQIHLHNLILVVRNHKGTSGVDIGLQISCLSIGDFFDMI